MNKEYEYISIAEAAAILNKSPQSIYKSKKYSPYIKTIDNKKYIDKKIIIGNASKEETNNKEDIELSTQLYNIIELLESTLKSKEKELEELKQAIKEKDNIIKSKDEIIMDLSRNAAETNNKLMILLRTEQTKNGLNLLNDEFKESLNDGLKNETAKTDKKPRRRRFLGIF